MTNDDGLPDLELRIAQLRQHIEDQEVLVEVLECDGHDVSKQEAALRQDRSRLALMISRRLALLD